MRQPIAGLSVWETWFLYLEQHTGIDLDGEGNQAKLDRIARAYGLSTFEEYAR